MMKKILSVLLLVVIFCSILNLTAFADNASEPEASPEPSSAPAETHTMDRTKNSIVFFALAAATLLIQEYFRRKKAAKKEDTLKK